MSNTTTGHKAEIFEEISQAVSQINQPVATNHPFYVDLSKVRSRDYKERKLYKALEVNSKNGFALSEALPQGNITLFLYGHRGSGKTTELLKYYENLHTPKGYFVVPCYLKDGLDPNDFTVADIIIYLTERLIEELQASGLEPPEQVLGSLKRWYAQTEQQVISSDKVEGSAEATVEAGITIPAILKSIVRLRTKLSGTEETRKVVRQTFINRFTDFAETFNAFLSNMVKELQAAGKGRDILFIIDDLEKGGNAQLRKRIVVDDSNYLEQLRANMVITLPVELYRHRTHLERYSQGIIPFPMVRLYEDRLGQVPIPQAHQALTAFITNRVSPTLFTNPSTQLPRLVEFSGGSPRQLMKLLYNAYLEAEEDILDDQAIDDAINSLGKLANFLRKEEWAVLKELHASNTNNLGYPDIDDTMQEMLHNEIIYEYNEGTFRCVNPIIAQSALYKQHVLK